jgi:hypothetical protein
MSVLTKNLSLMEEIAKNPNLNGGIWNSLDLFLSAAAEITLNISDFDKLSLPEEKKTAMIDEIQKIRSDFHEKCKVKDAENLERKKNSRCDGHRFKAQVSKFLQSYRGHFLIEEDKEN